jgi:hypothetical protein
MDQNDQISKVENIIFNQLFLPYKTMFDKHKTLYIIVSNNIIVEELIEKIKRMIIIIDSGSNPSKNAYRKARVNIFLNHLTGIKPESIVDGLFLLSETLDKFEIRPLWRETLSFFECDKFIETHDDTFDIAWLKTLFLDKSYINVLHFKGNSANYYYLGKIRKRFVFEISGKAININERIEEIKIKTPTNSDTWIIHGVSSFFKTLLESPNIHLLNGDKRDDEINYFVEQIKNYAKSLKLKSWLDKMSDLKEGSKLVFGSEIRENIDAQMLQYIFVTPERADKMLINFPDNNLEDKMIIIESFCSTDIGNKLKTEFKGAIGVKYY